MVPDGYEVFYVSAEEFAGAEHNTWMADLTLHLDVEPHSNLVDCSPLAGWYWWSCQPGCLPNGDPSGPFATQNETTHVNLRAAVNMLPSTDSEREQLAAFCRDLDERHNHD